MSKLLARLDGELMLVTDAVNRAELLARKASYLARVGRFSETREIIEKLRQGFGDGRSGHVTAWIMLTEGLLHLFEDLSPLAMDRIARSQVLGLAMKDDSVIAISSAWKAHLEFETSKFDAMVKSLQLARAHARSDDHDAFARLAMVISDSFLLCGRKREAQAWFLVSHDHALKDGDQASIEALLYNRAAFSLAWLRAERCLTSVDAEQVTLVRLEIESARNLQHLTGVAALTNFIHLCDARLLILEDKFPQAIGALGKVRNSRPFADYNFDQDFVNLELAFCMHQLRRFEDARSLYRSISWASFDKLDLDERLVASWMRVEMCEGDSSLEKFDVAKIELQALAQEYQETNAKLLESLRPFRNVD